MCFDVSIHDLPSTRRIPFLRCYLRKIWLCWQAIDRNRSRWLSAHTIFEIKRWVFEFAKEIVLFSCSIYQREAKLVLVGHSNKNRSQKYWAYECKHIFREEEQFLELVNAKISNEIRDADVRSMECKWALVTAVAELVLSIVYKGSVWLYFDAKRTIWIRVLLEFCWSFYVCWSF